MNTPHNDSLPILLRVMHENKLDPLMVFITIVGMELMGTDTCMGSQFEQLLIVAASESNMTMDAMIASFRGCFYGTKREGKMGVCKVSFVGQVFWQNAKKKTVLSMYLDSTPTESAQFPSLIQVIYPGNDSKSGARVHHVYKFPQNCIVACRDMIVSPNAPLSIMEVPHQLQGTRKWYIDWDMKVAKLVFLRGTVAARVDQARELALQTPAKICQIFMDLGYIEAGTLVQVVIKEGSRPAVGGSEIEKISFHFIFNLFGTSGQMQTLSNGLFQYLEEHAGTLSAILSDGTTPINEIDSMNGYECLVGVDMHPYSNPEQGLAMGFSRKDLRDPYTRFIEIMHVRYICFLFTLNRPNLAREYVY
jgi:hypothetical protein